MGGSRSKASSETEAATPAMASCVRFPCVAVIKYCQGVFELPSGISGTHPLQQCS